MPASLMRSRISSTPARCCPKCVCAPKKRPRLAPSLCPGRGSFRTAAPFREWLDLNSQGRPEPATRASVTPFATNSLRDNLEKNPSLTDQGYSRQERSVNRPYFGMSSTPLRVLINFRYLFTGFGRLSCPRWDLRLSRHFPFYVLARHSDALRRSA